MSSLEELLPSAESPRLSASQTDSRLGEIFGAPVAAPAPADGDAERLRLQGMVGAAGGLASAGDAQAVAMLPSAAATRTKARSRFLRKQRRDWLTVIAVGAAIVAVVVAGSLGVRTAMATTPTDDSRTLLTDSAEALASTISATNAERARLEAAIADTIAQSEHAATALAAMAGVVDEPARIALMNARDSYVSLVRALKLPAVLEPFEVTPVAANATLSEIGAALEIVDARQVEVDAVKVEIRDLNATLVAEREALGALVKPTADAMVVLAGAELVQRSAALPEFRSAVQSAANGVTAARSAGRMGWTEMQVLADAIRALRADDERALSEEPVEQETDSGWTPPSDGGGTVPTPDPGPVDPGPVDPGPVDPGPVDPGPVDPGPTDPDEPGDGA